MIKNFMIFGDSYSTHKDFIPEGYPHYYCTGGRGPKEPVTDMLPEETWWGRFINTTGANLVHNNSWSGSTIGYTGYAGDCSKSSSFIYRYDLLCESCFFTKNDIDTILVFGGTNDSWSNAPLGTYQFSDWKREDLFNVIPAICYFMGKLKEDHPDKRIVFIANCDIKNEVIDAMENAARHFGVECIKLSDIDKISGHPTVLGMKQIHDQIIEKLI